MPRCESRPINWTGRPTREAQMLTDWYAAELVRLGVLPAGDGEAWYAAALPGDGDGELWPMQPE
ncbi:hypothetical protein [Deinococcus phoenicis]|nr:hypothetical protein [Deinococcus phoenicis]